MSATILTFEHGLSRRKASDACGESADPMADACAARATFMSVPEAAFYAYFESQGPENPVEVIARLTGVGVGKLYSLWGGSRGLRVAGIRYALSMAMG